MYGSKWGFTQPRLITSRPETRFYEFRTAWSPVIPLIKAMSKMYPSLTFGLKYFEAGMEFQGEAIFENGEQTVDTNAPYYGSRGG